MTMQGEFDRLSQQATGCSRPLDPESDGEEWLARQKRLHRLIYRAGAIAQLGQSYDKLPDDALVRVRWLAEKGFVGSDVKDLANEVETWREKGDALRSNYGMTDSDLHSMIGEGFHTAFRKASDHPYAVTIHKLIKELPPEDWKSVLDFVAEPIISWLREAQKREEAKSHEA